MWSVECGELSNTLHTLLSTLYTIFPPCRSPY